MLVFSSRNTKHPSKKNHLHDIVREETVYMKLQTRENISSFAKSGFFSIIRETFLQFVILQFWFCWRDVVYPRECRNYLGILVIKQSVPIKNYKRNVVRCHVMFPLERLTFLTITLFIRTFCYLSAIWVVVESYMSENIE